MNRFLYIALVRFKAVEVATKSWVVLMTIQSDSPSPEILAETTYEMRIGTIEFKGLSSRVEIFHIRLVY